MTDLSKTISPKSDQMNADDLIGGPTTITVTRVSAAQGDNVQPIAVNFDGDNGKPWKPCKSMRRVLVHLWGKDGREYVGKSLTLFCDPSVKFGGIAVGGIRISHMSGIEKKATIALTSSRSKRTPFVVNVLEAPKQQGSSEDDIGAVKSDAMAAASRGKTSFMEFYNSPYGKDNRGVLKSIMGELQEAASKADATAAESDTGEDEDPFNPPS